ncbi:MATE family efflux transporter [[Clostridium] symbiosum]|uniref:MATE family efflux transporter n=1 Tax=Clostridium symbiosum TaxID=1512 RepID=UPI001D074896|nr:MATE family efflux transporter [[Clostridium] symbiosum]MCB6610876.1 polysaccharide biosynthesis C-terminal domain-containing protein [[Clostridium] symbiosum]MCB6933353.1 polysaccharide biosynthesis C-terminal domain-containing protein [[Clostridium] symbiosum]
MNNKNLPAENVYQKPVTLKNIIKFSVPTIVMTVFMSFYTMVDGLFVSNLIGTGALSAINLTAPAITLVTAVSTMLATGGSAVIMKKMGAGLQEESRQDFTFLILVNVAVGLIMYLAGRVVMQPIFSSMALSPVVSGYCSEYLGQYLLFTVPILLMNNFTIYMIASGKSRVPLVCTAAGGILNIVLDYVFIAILDMGIGGAAIATGLGYSVTAVAGLFLFSDKKNMLYFKKPVIRPEVLLHAASNGSSEMATSLVTGIVTLMFNWIMLKYAGEDGVAAITIIMYVLMFAGSIYTGYAYGVAPMISFYYGEKNSLKLKSLITTSLKIIGAVSVLAMALSIAATRPLVSVFVRPDNPVFGLAVTGNRICSLALLFIGFNIFTSSMFTALSNGFISALLAFTRSFVFMVAAMLILPAVLGINGAWLANPAAELMALFLSAFMYFRYKKRYRY